MIRASSFLRLAVPVTLLFTGAYLGACSLLTSYEHLEGGQASIDAALEADSATTVDDAATCTLATLPAPPEGAVDGPSRGPLVAAMKSISIVGGDPSSPPQGFDLDRRCTCPQPSSCTNGLSPHCDADGGVDNVALELFASLANDGFPLADDTLQESLKSGRFGLLFTVTGYSGLPNDPHVVVELFNATGGNDPDGGKPKFDGHDQWTLDSASFTGGVSTTSTFVAYVTDGVLVAPFVKVRTKFRIPTFVNTSLLLDLEFDDAFLVAKIRPDGDAGMSLEEGRLVGRVSISSWLLQIQRAGRCANTDSFRSFQQQLCGLRDLAARASADNSGASCETISAVIGFAAMPATIGGTRTPVEDPSICDGTLDPDAGCLP